MNFLPLLLQRDPFFSTPVGLTVMLLLAILGLILFVVLMKYGLLYIQAHLSNARVGILDLVGMTLRKISPPTVVFGERDDAEGIFGGPYVVRGAY